MVNAYHKSIKLRPYPQVDLNMQALDALESMATEAFNNSHRPLNRIAPRPKPLSNTVDTKPKQVIKRKVELKGGFYVEREYSV